MSDISPERDAGVQKAITEAGGVASLASKIGVSSQAVSQWKRIPAERVIEVERATGVRRERLRPDLYPQESAA